jgi:hypothetical protein
MRLKWDYKIKVKIPRTYRKFLWDYPGGTAPLEMMVLRILTYGTFRDITRLYREYSKEAYKLAFKYPAVKRGVRFWIRRWHGAHAEIGV